MAPEYWNPATWGSTATSGAGYGSSTTGTTGFSPSLIPVMVTRRIAVTHPETWTKEQSLRFVELVNVETTTCGKIELHIEGGKVLITDPAIESRTMAEFIPLMRRCASQTDLEKVDNFLKENPL